jgi:PAS domain S-box-containing protein
MLSRDQLNLIFNNSNDLIFLLAVVGEGEFRCLSVNKRYMEATGQPEEFFTDNLLRDMFPPQEVEYLQSQYAEAIRLKGPYRYDTRTDLKGNTIYLETTLVPVFGQQGRCDYLLGISRDVTQRKLERKALEEAKRQAENYLDIAEAIIVAIDKDARVTMLNRKGYALLGHKEGSLQGTNWAEVCLPPNKQALFLKGYQEFLHARRTQNTVSYLLAKNGEKFLIRWTNTPIKDDEGNYIGVLSSGEDITDRHRAEKSMIASQRVLAAGEIASAVAHDFNNSLQGILGNIEIALVQADLPDNVIQLLTNASQLAMDAAERTKVLQQVSGPSWGSEREQYEMNDLAAEVISQTKHLWKDDAAKQGNSIEISTRFSQEMQPSHGSKGELRSVIYNVIKNGLEAMPEGGRLEFETRFNRGSNIIEITDSGIGMDDATSTRLFQPFFSTKGYQSGRGLGMSAAHSIVNSHGGDIYVRETEIGIGSTITISLPVIVNPVEENIESAEKPEQTTLTILWVDDDPAIRSLAKQYIEKLGHRGDVAASGEEALKMMAETDYTTVFTDIGMPGMSGFDLAKEIGVLTDNRVPVVALTGWGETLSQQDQSDSGVIMVLSKPIRIGRLQEVLGQL